MGDGAGVTTESVKQWLLRYQATERAIDVQIERLEHLETRMKSTGSPNLDGMPRGSPTYDRIGSMLAQKEALETKIKGMIKAQADRRRTIEGYVDQLRKPEEQAAIEARYIDGAKWADVTMMLFGSKDDYLDREASYLRRVTKIHGKALLSLAAVMKTQPPEDLPTDGEEVEF